MVLLGTLSIPFILSDSLVEWYSKRMDFALSSANILVMNARTESVERDVPNRVMVRLASEDGLGRFSRLGETGIKIVERV